MQCPFFVPIRYDQPGKEMQTTNLVSTHNMYILHMVWATLLTINELFVVTKFGKNVFTHLQWHNTLLQLRKVASM